jgi:undecaprenyl diphosphate synthase
MKESPVSADQLPDHIAIIMDGNGRWAKSQGLDRAAGHEAGAKTVSTVVQRCAELEIPFLTLYSFSTENWTRPPEEIDALMQLLMFQLSAEVEQLVQNGIRLVHYGSRKRLSGEVLIALDGACAATAGGSGMTLGLALDYSGRTELLHVMKQLVEDGIEVDDIDEAAVQQRLFTAEAPDPDLLIRTAGEMRVSNFLLWQIAYSELYVVEKNWPAFNADDVDAALLAFSNRQRKYGTIK